MNGWEQRHAFPMTVVDSLLAVSVEKDGGGMGTAREEGDGGTLGREG